MKIYILTETVEEDGIRDFRVLLTTFIRDKALKEMERLFREDKYGYFKKYGVEEHSESCCSSNFADKYVAYNIEESEIEYDETVHTKTKEHSVSITFYWDDENETKLCVVTTPDNVTDSDVYIDILDAHDFLCDEDKEDRYGVHGRRASTLLDYLCETKNWTWKYVEAELELSLD